MLDINKVPSPCYVMEEELLRNNLKLIRRVADEAGIEIILAFKAFAVWKSFPLFREYIRHTTASSAYEARLAFEEFGSKAHTYSPAYTEDDFSEIRRCSVSVTFNSLGQFDKFYPMTKMNSEKISCGIRVNPEYSEVKVALYNPCASGSRFGVTFDRLPEKLPEGIEGFHCHCLCESDSYAFERILRQVEAKFSPWFPQLQWINFGGGHLMTRQGYDVEHLIAILTDFRRRYPQLRVILEPGSAFVWQTGPLIASVVDIVESHGIRTAILNVSFTCHMPDCLEMPYQPTVRGAETLPADVVRTAGSGEHIYRLGGNSCLSGDYMDCWRFDHELRIGERLVLEDMIHYTMVKTNMFNGVRHPSIAMWHTNDTLEVYRDFRYEDYRDRMS